jgi:hypothetical protein
VLRWPILTCFITQTLRMWVKARRLSGTGKQPVGLTGDPRGSQRCVGGVYRLPFCCEALSEHSFGMVCCLSDRPDRDGRRSTCDVGGLYSRCVRNASARARAGLSYGPYGRGAAYKTAVHRAVE